MTVTKPMLSGKAPEDLSKLKFPLLASPKLDGIRCLIVKGTALTRKFKPVPNKYVRQWCEKHLPDGFDGELLLRDWTAPFNDVSSAIMSKDGEPDFTYAAFDFVYGGALHVPFEKRYATLDQEVGALTQVGGAEQHLFRVRHWRIETVEELQAIHSQFLAEGFEGTMVRALDGEYKCGRSTQRQGWLLKIKNFEDEEATLVGVVEQMHNTNEAKLDNLGHTKRSSAKAGKVGAGKMGALQCRTSDGAEFEIGTGFTDAMRTAIWEGDKLLGRLVKFKHQPPPGGRRVGEAPRFPVFLGWRED